MENFTNDTMYQLFKIKNDQNKLRLQALYRPDLVSHISKLQDRIVYLSSERKDVSDVIQPAEDLVKSVMTTNVCVNNPSVYKGFDFKGLELYFGEFARIRQGGF